MAIRTWFAAAALSTLAGVGCSTKVGDGQAASAGSTLTAVITPIGHQAVTSGCGASVCITVRAGENVLLSGKDTVNEGAAIADFQWTAPAGALPDPPDSGALIYHSRNTVSFRAPQVAAGAAPLDFKFTVTNTIGQTSSATARVTIQPANDSNQFLSPLATRHHFIVAVAPTADVPSVTGQTSIPVCVTVQRQLTYTPAGATTAQTLSLTPLKADGSWSAAKGGVAGDFTAYQNPKVTFEIPALNQDDILSQTNKPGAPITLQPNAATVDSDQLQLVASAAPGSCDGSASASLPANVSLLVQVQDSSRSPVPAGSAGAASVTFTPDMLMAAEQGQYETAATARAYYDAIDPTGANTSLSKWLANNCFDETKPNFGATAHAVYTNNFDLGFGRDMYFTTCTAANKSPGREIGDSASVVLNYPSLEAAVLKQQPIIAVAMEHNRTTTVNGAPGTSSRLFTKFFVFAPDSTDGAFKRVLSANFDGRGEKFVPGACVMCHGGTLPKLQPNFVHQCTAPQSCNGDQTFGTIDDPTQSQTQPVPQLAAGDIDAGFMPWDIDSLLFSNSDPAYTGALVSKAGYQQTDQEADIKKLNQLAYCTMQPEVIHVAAVGQQPAKDVDRYLTVRQLISRWYGGSSAAPPDTDCAASGTPTASLLPNAKYSDQDSAPDAWTGKTAPGAAATPTVASEGIYHQVLARHCRACHVMDANVSDQFADYPSFISFFQPSQSGPGLGLQYLYQQGRMPLARLTDDRFWVDGAATILAKHILEVNGSADTASAALLDSSGNVVGPGKPVINFKLTAGSASAPSGARFAGAMTNAFDSIAPSFFVNKATWSLDFDSGSAHSSPAVIGGSSGAPAFATDDPGTYNLTLTADNGFGGTATSSPVSYVVVPKRPTFTCANPYSTNAERGQASVVNIGPTGIGLDPKNCIGLGDGLNTVQFEDPANAGTWVPAIANPNSTGVAGTLSGADWLAQISGDPTGNSINSIAGHVISFTYTNPPPNPPRATPVTVNYRVSNVDGLCPTGSLATNDCASRSITFNLTKQLADLPLPINFPQVFDNSGNLVSTYLTASDFVIPTSFLLQGLPPAEINQFNVSGNSANLTGTGAVTSGNTDLHYKFAAASQLTCDVNNASLSGTPCGNETFKYTASGPGNLLVTGAGGPATISLQTRATTSFSQNTPAIYGLPATTNGVYSMLQTCSTCHVSGSATNNGGVFAKDQWQYQTSDASGTYGGIPGGPGIGQWVTKDNNSNPRAANRPDLSAIYQNACQSGGGNGYSHGGPLLSSNQCKYVLQWLAEGGNFN